jgi:hypothetical protein
MHATGEYSFSELMEFFCVGRATVYRVLERVAGLVPSRAVGTAGGQ